jgi:sensor domain CHASE-containing protein
MNYVIFAVLSLILGVQISLATHMVRLQDIQSRLEQQNHELRTKVDEVNNSLNLLLDVMQVLLVEPPTEQNEDISPGDLPEDNDIPAFQKTNPSIREI